MPPRTDPGRGRGRGRGRGLPPNPRQGVARQTRANARGIGTVPIQPEEAVPDRTIRRIRIAEARATLEAEITAGVYDDVQEDESISSPAHAPMPAPVPEDP